MNNQNHNHENSLACLLLAAGESTIFNQGHKLLYKRQERPLIDYARTAVENLPASDLILVTSKTLLTEIQDLVDLTSWMVVINEEPKRGINHSLKIGVSRF